VGHQIIKQPDGKYAIYSTGVDAWIFYDGTAEEVVDFYVEKAEKEARRHTQEILDLLDENPKRAYFQFTMTFEEADAASAAGQGKTLEQLRAEEEDYDPDKDFE
jgi:hypothetical protein